MSTKTPSISTLCPLCGTSGNRELPYGGYLRKEKKLPLIHCGACSLKYIAHGLTEDELAALYNTEGYFIADYGGGASRAYFENETELVEKARHALRIIRRFKFPGKLLEVGCAGGYFLREAQKRGYEVHGIDVAEGILARARGEGFDVQATTLEKLPIAPYDVIYLADVLEHVSNPAAFRAELVKRLAPGGIVVLELPLTYNVPAVGLFVGLFNLLRGRVGYRYWLPAPARLKYLNEPPYHLLFFSGRSIRRFVKDGGLELCYLRTYDGFPKEHFKGTFFYALKRLTHALTRVVPQSFFGDRAFVVARLDRKLS